MRISTIRPFKNFASSATTCQKAGNQSSSHRAFLKRRSAARKWSGCTNAKNSSDAVPGVSTGLLISDAASLGIDEAAGVAWSDPGIAEIADEFPTAELIIWKLDESLPALGTKLLSPL